MSLPIRRLLGAGLCLAAGLAGTALLAAPAQAAPGLTGKQLVSASSAYTNAPHKTQKASCPAGKVVISGGAFVQGPLHVKINMLRPVETGNFYEAAANNPWGRSPWSLHTYAICADRPAGLQYLSADSVQNVGVKHSVSLPCPAGKQLIGLGGRAAAEPNRNVTLDYVVPIGGNGAGAFAGSVAAQGGEPLNWTATVYAVCANNLGATVEMDSSPTNSDGSRSMSSTCLPGKLAAVGGAVNSTVPGGNGQVGFGSIYPDASLSEGVAIAHEDHDGYPGAWSLNSYAICA